MAKKKFMIAAACLAAVIAIGSFSACGEGNVDDTNIDDTNITDTDDTTFDVSSLTIVSAPDKTVYEEGEYFDNTGLVINATLNDGTVEENVAYIVETKTALKVSSTNVRVSYGGQEISISVTVTYKGNNAMYSVENTDVLENSVLKGKTYYFLGSSVTYGYGSDGESMADFLAKRNDCSVIKEAVSGTMLADISSSSGKSYVKRLEEYIASDACVDSLDAFVCQLSTNDAYNASLFGEVTASDVKDIDQFNKETTFGAIEYIIALVTETWNCPIVFYTSNHYGNANYVTMINALYEVKEKWGITVIDLYNDTDFNDITTEQKALYMVDNVHPTKAGYREWWLPKFEEALTDLL